MSDSRQRQTINTTPVSLRDAITNCVDGLGKYVALRGELFRLRLAHRGLPGGPWRPRYKRDSKQGDPTLPSKITHHTGTVKIEGCEFEGVAYIAEPETYAPFSDLELINSNDETAPEGSEASKAALSLWFVLNTLLDTVKAIVGSIVHIERQAKGMHLKTDTTPLSQLLVHLPVFPYWPDAKGLQKDDYDKVLADERPLIEAAKLALHRLGIEINAPTVAKPRLTAESLMSRLFEIEENLRHLQDRQPPTLLVSSRKPDTGAVTVADDPGFKFVAHSAGNLLVALPTHWRFGISEKTEALLQPSERWVGAVLDLAFAGVIKLPTWDASDRVEVLEDSVTASILAVQGIIKNSKRPHKGTGTFAAQREMATADAEENENKIHVEKRPDLAALYLWASCGVNHAAQLVRMSRMASAVVPDAFIGSFVRLEESLNRLTALDLQRLMSQWPEVPQGFTWGRKTYSSALERGIMFAKSIHRASAIARSLHRLPANDGYWDSQPVAPVPGEGIVRWSELTMQELREHTIPLGYVWPTLGDVDEDMGRIAFAIAAEYRQALAGCPPSGGAKIETPDEEALRVIYDTGRAMETQPNFRGRGEEDLRAVFLCSLKACSFGVTAESLNGKGKTDLLVAHNGTNILIGECKFWGGQKKYFDTIDQLTGYVIDRDPRGVILLFIDGKDVPLVTSQIDQKTREHLLWSKSYGKVRDNWYEFDFRKSTGTEKTTRVSIMCFHLPAPNS